MNNGAFVENKKDVLLRLFGEIRSAKDLELYINPALSGDTADKESCLDSIITLKYKDGTVEFPIVHPSPISKEDINLAEDFYSIILCEEGVKKGDLFRNGIRYIPVSGIEIKEPGKFGRYLTK